MHRGDRRLDALKQTRNEHRQNPADLDRNAPVAVKGRHDDINEIELQLDTVSFSTSESDFGVIFDNKLKMTDHVAALCRSCIFQQRQIRSIRRSLASDAMQKSECVRYK